MAITTTINISETVPGARRLIQLLAVGSGAGSSDVSVSGERGIIYSGMISWSAPGDVRYIPIGDQLGQIVVTCGNAKADGDALVYGRVIESAESAIPQAIANGGSGPNGAGTIYAPLATILGVVAAAGTIAQPTDRKDGRLASTGSKWIGYLGTFLTEAEASALVTTNLGQGAWLNQYDVGLRFWDPDSSAWRTAPAAIPAPI